MFSLTKWIVAPALVIGLMYAADAPSAEAQYGCYRGGHSGYGVGYRGSGVSLSIGNRYGGYRYGSHYRGGYGLGSHYGYGSHRGHYDYHPPELVPHGNHFHIQPGHWDYHRGRH